MKGIIGSIEISRVDIDRFWNSVTKTEHCWIWAGSKSFGYGYFMLNSKRLRAHRVSWMIQNGPISNGLAVLHSCDNPACVNPGHLFLGTDLDNAIDRENKGRTARGARCGATTHPERVLRGSAVGGSKLTEEQVREIRGSSGLPRELAVKFGVSRRTIAAIVGRRIWKHVA